MHTINPLFTFCRYCTCTWIKYANRKITWLKAGPLIQGVPIENCQKYVNGCRTKSMHLNPMLIKPKCVWEAVDFLKNCKKRLTILLKFSKIENIYHLSNTLWFYQDRVKSAPFQFYSHILLTILNRNILYATFLTKHQMSQNAFEKQSTFSKL